MRNNSVKNLMTLYDQHEDSTHELEDDEEDEDKSKCKKKRNHYSNSIYKSKREVKTVSETHISEIGTPKEIWRIAKLAYRTHVKGYAKEHLKNMEVLESGCVNGCNFHLIRNVLTGKLMVAFEGTASMRHIIDDIRSQIKDLDGHLSGMNKVLQGWEEKYGNIDALIGHSQGGYYATHCFQGRDVYRITFNGHKCERGDKNINLALKGDWVSKYTSVQDRYLLIGKGGHTLADFKQYVTEVSWHELLTDDMVNQYKLSL